MTALGARDVAAVLVRPIREHAREVYLVGLPVALDLDLAQALGVPHHLVDGAEAQARHDLAQLGGRELHEVDDLLGRAREAAAELAVLRGDAGRAGILLAVALHEAAHGYERHRREAKLLRAEERRDGDVSAVHELAVRLDDDAAAQAVHEERLLGLGQADLERDASVPDRVARGGAGAAVVAADRNLVGHRPWRRPSRWYPRPQGRRASR